MVIVADAGMLSAANFTELEDAGLRFIVGSRQTKEPDVLATFIAWNGTKTDDGRLVDTQTPRARVALNKIRALFRAEPVWLPVEHPHAWREVCQYRRKLAVRDRETINLRRNRHRRAIEAQGGKLCERRKGRRRSSTSPVATEQWAWPGEGLRHRYRSHVRDGTRSR